MSSTQPIFITWFCRGIHEIHNHGMSSAAIRNNLHLLHTVSNKWLYLRIPESQESKPKQMPTVKGWYLCQSCHPLSTKGANHHQLRPPKWRSSSGAHRSTRSRAFACWPSGGQSGPPCNPTSARPPAMPPMGWANTPLPAGWLLLVLKGKLAGRNMCSSEVSILCHILAALRPWHIEGSRAHGDSYGTTDDLPWMKHVKFTKNMSDTSGLVLLSVFCSSDSCVINLESPPYLWYPMTISSLSHPANSPSPVSGCNVFTYPISCAPISILDQSGHYRNNSQTCPPVLQTAALIWIIRHKSRGWI